MEKTASRKVWVLSLISLLTDIASEMLYPIMPLYLKHIGFKMAFIGFLEGIAELITALSKGYFGHLSDSMGKRVPFIRWGYSFSAVAKPLTVFIAHPVWVLLTRATDRLGKGLRTGARDAILMEESTVQNRSRIFGLHRSMDTIGATIGALSAFILISMDGINYTQIFLIAAIPGAFAVACTFLLKENILKEDKPTTQQKISFFSYLLYWKTATPQYKQLVTGFVFFFVFNTSDIFLLLFLKHQGHAETFIIGCYILYTIFYALLAYPVGILADKCGNRTLYLCGLFWFTITYLLLPFATQTWQIITLFIIYGAFSACTEGIGKAWLSNHSLPSHKATAFGFFGSVASIAIIMGNTLLGFLWDFIQPAFALWASAAGALVCILYFLTGKRKML